MVQVHQSKVRWEDSELNDLAFRTVMNLMLPGDEEVRLKAFNVNVQNLVSVIKEGLKRVPITTCVFATPEASVVTDTSSPDFFKVARKAQQNWLHEFRSHLSNRTLRQELKWSSPLERQLLFSGVMIADGKHIANNNWGNVSPAQDLRGQIFGYLTVINRLNGRWRCKCFCGNIIPVRTNRLLNGKTHSCGCLLQKSGEIQTISPVSSTLEGQSCEFSPPSRSAE